MACLGFETGTLLANCLSSAKKDGINVLTHEQLESIVFHLANYFDRYIFCNLSDDALSETVDKYPNIFYMADAKSVGLYDVGVNLNYFNFGYPPEVIEKIPDIVKEVI